MRTVRYSRYEGPAEEVGLEELLRQLQDLLLESGFSNDPWDPDPEAGREYADLLAAIAAALQAGDLVDQELIDEALDADDWHETRLGQLATRLAERLEQAGWIRLLPGAAGGSRAEPVSFALTARTVALLGNTALEQIMGLRAGRLPGSHLTRQSGNGTESSSISRPYTFGDSASLDAAATLQSAALRGSSGGRLHIEPDDLHVQESEFSTKVATVLMLDCSHSMILYGEDRFTPGKRVALAMAQLIRSRYRGDSLRFVLFHDSAEEVTLEQLAGMQVGPFHTNTAQGLKLARRLLAREQADSRQIIMVTDGKPTAITLPGGRIYRNAYGQDALVLAETLREAAACRRSGITVSTFMLADDPALLAFVQKVTELTRGRAFLTDAAGMGKFVLQEFSRNRGRH